MHRDAVLPRVTTWLVLVAYVLVVSGLPLPLGVAGADAPRGTVAEKRLAAKDRTQPFPCMDKPCGCATAEQCFSRCCCHTPAETLAWARAHRVEAAVLQALERRVANSVAAPTGGCCAAKATKAAQPRKSSCCVLEPATKKPTKQEPTKHEPTTDVCSEYQSLAAAPDAVEEPPAEPADPPGSRVVVLRAMLACGGIVAQWFTTAVSLPPPRLTLSLSPELVERLQFVDDEGGGLASIPEIPPPRVACG